MHIWGSSASGTGLHNMASSLIGMWAYSPIGRSIANWRSHGAPVTSPKIWDYSLTFRCVNCGKHEVVAAYHSEDALTEGELRARIYQASCGACGWKGSACGFSAIQIGEAR
jgi:heterodisulfide reductase subunit A-like polyferredoxin